MEQLRKALPKAGFAVYTLTPSHGVGEEALFAWLVDAFRTKEFYPDEISTWDGLSDVIWQALQGRPEQRVALIWRDADVIMATQLQLFLDALELLHHVADTVREATRGNVHPVVLRIVLLGTGLNFPEWE